MNGSSSSSSSDNKENHQEEDVLKLHEDEAYSQSVAPPNIIITNDATNLPATNKNDNDNDDNNNNKNNTHRILAVYKFVQDKLSPNQLPQLKHDIEAFCLRHQVRGSLLLAPEGINGTISYPYYGSHPTESRETSKEQEEENGTTTTSKDIEDPVLDFLQSQFPGLRTRVSYSQEGHVFYRLKIKLKQHILTCRTDDDLEINLDPNQQVGQYVKPQEWNALLKDPDCLVVDARNDYEVRIGSFENALDPHTTIFSELLPWMQSQLQVKQPKKVAMFCTGGIRCEKATAACLDLIQQQQQQQQSTAEETNGTTEIPVYHLEGGILAYLDEIPPSESLWHGNCYVFDQRVAVGHGLQPAVGMSMCHACRQPLTLQEQEGHPDFVYGKQCLYCQDSLTNKQKERAAARHTQIQLAQQQGQLHIHDPKEKVLNVLAQQGKQKQQKEKQQQEKQQPQDSTDSNPTPEDSTQQ